MKRKLTPEESKVNKRAKTEQSSIVYQTVMPPEGKFANKKITFRLKEEAVPGYMLSMSRYETEYKKKGYANPKKLENEQREYLKTIAETGSLELFDKKLKQLQEFFNKKKKVMGTWFLLMGIWGHINYNGLVFWIISNERYDMLDSVKKHTIAFCQQCISPKEARNFNEHQFIEDILPHLFKSHLALNKIIKFIDHFKPKEMNTIQFIKKFFMWKNEEANIIECLIRASWKDNNSDTNFDYFNKIKWLVEQGETIPPGIIRRSIANRDSYQGFYWGGLVTEGSIFKNYNENTQQLFKLLLDHDKDRDGLFDVALKAKTEHLRFLIDNGFGPQEWKLDLVVKLGLLEKYQVLTKSSIERNHLFLREAAAENNFLEFSLKSASYVDVQQYFSMIHFMIKNHSELLKLGNPDIAFNLIKKMGKIATKLYKKMPTSNHSDNRMQDDKPSSKEEKTSHPNHYWPMMSDIFYSAFEILKSQNLTAENMQPLCAGLASLLIVEYKHYKKIDKSAAILHTFVTMLKQKKDFALALQVNWIGLLLKNMPIECAKTILIELAKENLDLSVGVIAAAQFYNIDGSHPDIKPAKEVLDNLKFLFAEKAIKEHIKNHTVLSIAMHLVTYCTGKELIEIYNLLHELGGDYQFRLTAALRNDFNSISKVINAENSLLLDHLRGFVYYQKELRHVRRAADKKKYNEQAAFEITKLLLEKKNDPMIEFKTVFNFGGYLFNGNLFDYIAMLNRVGYLVYHDAEGTQYLELHEQEFSRNERYRQAMQAARDRAEARVLQGPNEQKQMPRLARQAEAKAGAAVMDQAQNVVRQAQEIARQAEERARQGENNALHIYNLAQLQAGNGPIPLQPPAHPPMLPQALQQPVPPRAPVQRPQPQLQRIHEDKQNTHGRAVHEHTAVAALKLKKRYLSESGQNLHNFLTHIFQTIYKHYVNLVIIDLEAPLNLSHPAEKYADQAYRKAQIDSTIQAVKKNILLANFEVAKSFYYFPSDFVPELWKLKSFIACRSLRVTLCSMMEWCEPTTQVSLAECLCSVWLALNDGKNCTNDKDSMIRLLTERLVDIQHEYQNERKEFSPTCPSGAFNQLISTLEGQHPDVPMINRIRVGNLFDYLIGYYEEKFNHLNIDQKRQYFNELLTKDNYNTDELIPSKFITDFEKGFYEKHQPDIEKTYITLQDIKNLFHNEYVPWLVSKFRVISEFIKQERAAKKSASQSSSNSDNRYTHFAQQSVLPHVRLHNENIPQANAVPLPMEDDRGPRANAAPQIPALQVPTPAALPAPVIAGNNPFGLFALAAQVPQPDQHLPNNQQDANQNGNEGTAAAKMDVS